MAHTARYQSATGSVQWRFSPDFQWQKNHDPDATTGFAVKDRCMEFDVDCFKEE